MTHVKCTGCHKMVWVEHEDDQLAFCCDDGNAHITIREYLERGCNRTEISDKIVYEYPETNYTWADK